jgi:hypothetical protein
MKRGDRVRFKKLDSDTGVKFASVRPEYYTDTVCEVDGLEELPTGKRYAWLRVPLVEERMSVPLELLEVVR